MGIIKGPFDRSDWETMLRLKDDVAHLSRIDKEKYKLSIRRERKELGTYMKREA